MLEELDEEICCDENGGRDAKVGRDIVRVSDDIRIKNKEKNSKECSERTGAFFRISVEKICGEEAKKNNRKPREENDEIGVITKSVDEERPDIPLFVDALRPEWVIDGKCRLKEEEWEADEILQKRWVLVVDAHVTIPDIAVGCWDMRALIIGRGIIPGREERESEEDREHDGCYDGRTVLDGLKEMMHRRSGTCLLFTAYCSLIFGMTITLKFA